MTIYIDWWLIPTFIIFIPFITSVFKKIFSEKKERRRKRDWDLSTVIIYSGCWSAAFSMMIARWMWIK